MIELGINNTSWYWFGTWDGSLESQWTSLRFVLISVGLTSFQLSTFHDRALRYGMIGIFTGAAFEILKQYLKSGKIVAFKGLRQWLKYLEVGPRHH